MLPDPLIFNDGSPVTNAPQWQRRRVEIQTLFETYVYGQAPPPPGNVVGEEILHRPVFDGAALQRIFMLRFGPQQKLTIRLSTVMPLGASQPRRLPVALSLMRGDHLPEDGLWPNCDLIARRGYLGVCFGNADCDLDKPDRTDGYHPFYPGYTWATLAVWAWGMQRVVDWLIAQDFVDAGKIAVTGHSRRGKAALLAAALDQRIALAAPSGSGAGGVGLSRHAKTVGGAETVSAITKQFPYWFVPRLAEYARRVEDLPVDQHMLIALMAPRPVMNCDGLDDRWANPSGEKAAMLAALPVYDLLGAGGIGNKMAMRFRPGGHDMTREDLSAILDFCDRQFQHGE